MSNPQKIIPTTSWTFPNYLGRPTISILMFVLIIGSIRFNRICLLEGFLLLHKSVSIILDIIPLKSGRTLHFFSSTKKFIMKEKFHRKVRTPPPFRLYPPGLTTAQKHGIKPKNKMDEISQKNLSLFYYVNILDERFLGREVLLYAQF